MPDKLDPKVVQYLESQLGTGSVKEGVLGKQRNLKELKRTSSSAGFVVHIPLTGSMKRSRSICPDTATSRDIARQLDEIAAMEIGEDYVVNSNKVSKLFSLGESDDLSTSSSIACLSRQSSVVEDVMILHTPSTRRTRFESEMQYEETELDDLVDMLRVTNDMEVHGDILHYMVVTYGMQFETSIGVVKDLLRELYESACVAKHWGIVRHIH